MSLREVDETTALMDSTRNKADIIMAEDIKPIQIIKSDSKAESLPAYETIPEESLHDDLGPDDALAEDANGNNDDAATADDAMSEYSNLAALATEEDTAIVSTDHSSTEPIHSSQGKDNAPAPAGSTADVVSIPLDEPEATDSTTEVKQPSESKCSRGCTRVLEYRRLYAVCIILVGVIFVVSGIAATWAGELIAPGMVLILAGLLVFLIDRMQKSHRRRRGPRVSLLKAILTPRPDPKKKRAAEEGKTETVVELDGHHASVRKVDGSPKQAHWE